MAIDINNVTLGNIKQQGNERAAQKAGSAGGQSQSSNVDAQNDKVELSADAKRLQQLKADETSSFDQQKVDEIKRALAEGEYPIDNEQLASKFYDLETQLNQ